MRILPLAADPRRLAATLDTVRPHLDARGPWSQGPVGADALLFLTGGTEAQALTHLERGVPPLLLAHPDHNSLAAALEVAAWGRQRGLDARVEQLGAPALHGVDRSVPVRDRILAGRRIGRVGGSSPWLVASTPEPEVVQRVWGVEVVDVPLPEFTEHARTADAWRAGADAVLPDAGALGPAAGVHAALDALRRSARTDGLAVACFDLVRDTGVTACMALSELLDSGVTAACEGDLVAALTMEWVLARTGQVGFLANPQRVHPSGAVELAHCTIPRRMTERHVLRSHFETRRSVAISGRIRPGPATLVRLGGRELDRAWVAEGYVTSEEPVPTRCRTQARVLLAPADAASLLAAPLGNHHLVVLGHHRDALLPPRP